MQRGHSVSRRPWFAKLRKILLAVAGLCAVIGSTQALAETLNAVATFSILGDMVRRVGGDRVQVHNLVEAGNDAHVFQPTPADAKKIAGANLVVVNGLGFEGWIDRLIKSSGYKGRIVVATTGIKVLKQAEDHEESAHEGHAHGAVDPHAWQDLANADRYVANIAQALSEADPAGKNVYEANAAAYRKELGSLDTEIKAIFNAIPKERRKVVSSHDAFGYFSRAYGVRFVSPVGISTEAEPSAAGTARIIKQIRAERIPAVFMENISSPRLIERIQKESGAKVGGVLYSDSLSPASGPAATYLDLMRHNAQVIGDALRP